MKTIVTGATGYIGGRLVPRLVDAGHEVRVLVRNAERLRDVPWLGRVEVVEGDLGDPAAIAAALRDREVLYYLVHSMSASASFELMESEIAHAVAKEALAAKLLRIVYLGGLHPDGPLSPHLRSRTEVGRVLLESGVPTAALQAGVVIGSGSASFEMIRNLTEVLPYMPAPRWVRNHIQPIAVRDVLYYLIQSAELPPEVNRTFDIGGPDVLRYGQMMNGYAVEAGLRQRPIASLPVLTPWLAGQWVNLVTPIPRSLAVPLVSSLQHDAVVRENDIAEHIPDPEGGLTGYRRAVRLALGKLRDGEVETSWQDGAVSGAPSDPLPSDPEWAGYRVYTDARHRVSRATPDQLWSVVEGIGGENGWYSFPLAWALRGWLDKLLGGVGLRRGRRDAVRLAPGDALDFWRVEAIERGSFLRLRAEMRVPGSAWLELRVEPDGEGSSYRQRAVFFPRGLLGRAYWYAIVPLHGIVFAGMANRITAAAEELAETSGAEGHETVTRKITKR